MPGLLLAWLSVAPVASGHLLGMTDAAIEVATSGVRIVHTLPLAELAELPERDAGATALREAVASGWRVWAGGAACQLERIAVRELSQLRARQFDLQFACESVSGKLEVGYRLASRLDPAHVTMGRVLLGSRPLPWRFSRARPVLRVPLDQVLARSGIELPSAFSAGDPNAAPDPGESTASAASAARPAQASPKSAAASTVTSTTVSMLWSTAAMYVPSGVEHIVLGPDHVAFVIGLLLVPLTLRRLVVSVSLFTLAHSLTLALTWYGLIALAPAVTEPLIALSVVAMGIENLLGAGRDGGAALRFREATVFGFGLIHGIGLSYQLGVLPAHSPLEAVARLLAFNVGVELGQLAIVLVAGLPLAWALRRRWGVHITIPGSAVLIGLGAFWFLQRIG